MSWALLVLPLAYIGAAVIGTRLGEKLGYFPGAAAAAALCIASTVLLLR